MKRFAAALILSASLSACAGTTTYVTEDDGSQQALTVSDVWVDQEFPINGSTKVPTNTPLSVAFTGRILSSAANFSTERVTLINTMDGTIVPLQVTLSSDGRGFNAQPMTGSSLSTLEPSTDYTLVVNLFDEANVPIQTFRTDFTTEDVSSASGFHVLNLFPGGKKNSKYITSSAPLVVQMSDRIKPNAYICSDTSYSGNDPEVRSAISALRQAVTVNAGSLAGGISYGNVAVRACIDCSDGGICNRIRISPTAGRWPAPAILNLGIKRNSSTGGSLIDLRGITQGGMTEDFSTFKTGGILVPY